MSENKVFISYSHDSEAHKQWVLDLAEYLSENNIEVVFDQWNLALGDDIALFMEEGIRNSDRVLVICTDNYIKKANIGEKGVGYEKTICTAEIFRNPQDRSKFIPIVRDVKGTKKLPTFFGAAYYLDLSEGSDCPEERRKLVEAIGRVQSRQPDLHNSNIIPQQSVSYNDSSVPLQVPSLGQATIVEFSRRFAMAFPGLRSVQWIDDQQVIAERLGIVLSQPLRYKEGSLAWWWRGNENLQISKFEQVQGRKFLMDYQELNIHRIAAVNRINIYYRKFIYVETFADSPTGLYKTRNEDITQLAEQDGYCCEEYGFVDDSRLITRAELDDGATIIDGTPVDVQGRAVPRIRYITPFNFLIAPHMSPINNNDFDYILLTLLNQMLQGKEVFSEICDAIDCLPKQN